GKSGSFTGTAADTIFGPVQVRATVAGGKLTAVTVLQVPDRGGYEQNIVATDVPQLTSEALSAQSAHIESVSGATYTSQGYMQSLQSALDQAGL
ncbi:MAG TPA: FMN-binding protein, partial [Actinocrinis sp.]